MASPTEVTYVGGKSFIILRPEATYGTYDSGGTDEKKVIGTNFTNPMKNNTIKLYSLGGGRNYVQAVPGKFEVDGTLEFDMQNAKLMKYSLGAIGTWAWAGGTWTKTDGAATPTYHPAFDLDGVAITGTPAPTALNLYHVSEYDTLPAFSIDQIEISSAYDCDTQIRYLGCKVNTTTISADTEKPLHATLDWIGRVPTLVTDFAALAEPTVAAYTDVVPMFYKGSLIMGSTVSVPTGTTLTAAETAGPAKQSVAGTTVITCNSVEVKATNNLDKYFSINNTSGRGTEFLLEKQREYTLTLDLNFANTAQFKRFLNGTTTATDPTVATYTPFTLILDYKTDNAQGDAFKQMRFIFQEVTFDETTIPVSPTEIVKQNITAFAKKLDVFYITNEEQV